MRLLDLLEGEPGPAGDLTRETFESTLSSVVHEILSTGRAKTLWDIGNGLCYEVASETMEALAPYGVDHLRGGGAGVEEMMTEDFWYDDFLVDLNKLRQAGEQVPDDLDPTKLSEVLGSATHAWLKFDGLYYDAEAVKGVPRFLQMPFFARHIEALRQETRGIVESQSTAPSLYHGSYSPGVLKSVMKNGLKGREEQGRASLAPMKGRVYMTPSLRYAIIYAIGGDVLGHKQPPDRIKPDERYGYVFEIDPSDLSDDILPDEDIVGAALVGAHRIHNLKKSNPYSEIEKELQQNPDLTRSLAYLFDTFTRDVPSIRKGALEGMLSSWAKLGKRVLKYRGTGDLTMKALLGLKSMHQSHGGGVMPVRAWRFDRQLTHKLTKDGSNFFDLAKLVWDRTGAE